MGGGIGAGPMAAGGDGLHAHMSNTLNTPIEALEFSYPLRVRRYALRRGSGGRGLHRGGEGLVREVQFLVPVAATITSERRRRGAYGLQGGEAGLCGRNVRVGVDGGETILPAKVTLELEAGEGLRIETPGGGGWGDGLVEG
ncbi:MAG: hydantoinase B/oxoprolinase family protein [Chloroflexi bacterium]|nr:hydantoinase B/oxoprolinase family protein [Chloroflexota bacterium]